MILFIAALNAASSQDVTLECDFLLYFGDYTCRLEGVEVTNESANVVFTGTHMEGMTNDNVAVVEFRRSTTPFMIQEVFSTFPNIDELEYDNCGLETISMPSPTSIQYLTLINNNIQRIEDNTFVSQPQIRSLRLFNSNIHELGEDAFLGLANLTSLSMINNRISEILPRTFEPLVSVSYLDMERNNLTRVGDFYSNNLELRSLYLEYNQIVAISPTFVRHLRSENLNLVNLNGNVCAQRFFFLSTDGEWNIMTNALNGCFRAFVGPQPDIELQCRFELDWFDRYVCLLREVQVLNEFADVIFNGEHMGDRTNDDVEIVHIYNSSTPFMIQEIFTTFPNTIELEYDMSGLESIFMPAATRIESLVVTRNNISTITDRTFASNPQLRVLRLTNNNIQELSPDAFVGLGNLTSLGMINNRIQTVHPRTFNPLVSVTYLDMERNNLTSVGEFYSANVNLQSLYLEYNQIEEISPRFVQHLREQRLTYVNLNGNVCAQRSFSLSPTNSEGWIIMNGALQSCFRTFENIQEDTPRRITLEFVGSLSIFDGSGNILASF